MIAPKNQKIKMTTIEENPKYDVSEIKGLTSFNEEEEEI